MSGLSPTTNSSKQARVVSVLASNGTFIVPAGFAIQSITFSNSTANAVTGGIRIGTTDGGAQVVAAQSVVGNALLQVADAAMLLKIFSLSSNTTLYVQAVSSWNSASVTMYVTLQKV